MWHEKKNPFEVLPFLWDGSLIFFFFLMSPFVMECSDEAASSRGCYRAQVRVWDTVNVVVNAGQPPACPGEWGCSCRCRTLHLPSLEFRQFFSVPLSLLRSLWRAAQHWGLCHHWDLCITEICVITELLRRHWPFIQAINKLIKQYWAQH